MSPSRKSFILTYGISGGFIDYGTFASDERLASIDECHYTTDSVVVYSYLHFKRAVDPESVLAFMQRMKIERNIVLFEVFGYSAISTTSDGENLIDHVGMKMLLSHYQNKNPLFKSCTDGNPGISRGLLWKYDCMSRLRDLVGKRSKLAGNFLHELEKELAETRQKAEMVDLLTEQLAEQDVLLRQYKETNNRLEFTVQALKFRMNLLSKEDREMMCAPDHRGRPLV